MKTMSTDDDLLIDRSRFGLFAAVAVCLAPGPIGPLKGQKGKADLVTVAVTVGKESNEATKRERERPSCGVCDAMRNPWP